MTRVILSREYSCPRGVIHAMAVQRPDGTLDVTALAAPLELNRLPGVQLIVQRCAAEVRREAEAVLAKEAQP